MWTNIKETLNTLLLLLPREVVLRKEARSSAEPLSSLLTNPHTGTDVSVFTDVLLCCAAHVSQSCVEVSEEREQLELGAIMLLNDFTSL